MQAVTRRTTTAFAILGQLALAPRTTYALAKQMRANLHFFWPRAESRIYEGIRRLVDDELVHETRIPFGRRSRGRYELTPAGRAALADWLATPVSGSTLEHEAILRVFLAAFGSRAALLDAIDRVAADAEEIFAAGAEVGPQFLAGTHPFQDQIHVRALVFDFLSSYAQALRGWSERARAEVESWEDTAVEGKRAAARARIATALAEFSPR